MYTLAEYVKYFNDIPEKVMSSYNNIDLSLINRLSDEMLNDRGATTATYYPPFEWVINGKYDISGRTVVSINYLNYKGVMCGLPDGTSGWNKPITRAEAVTVLARAFRKGQRIPEDKRAKDKSIYKFDAGGDMTSIEAIISEYNEDWHMNQKKTWFENSLGIYFWEDTYEELLKQHIMSVTSYTRRHFDTYGFGDIREQWYWCITKGFPELEIQINPEGLHKYKEYCKGINVFFPEK